MLHRGIYRIQLQVLKSQPSKQMLIKDKGSKIVLDAKKNTPMAVKCANHVWNVVIAVKNPVKLCKNVAATGTAVFAVKIVVSLLWTFVAIKIPAKFLGSPETVKKCDNLSFI